MDQILRDCLESYPILLLPPIKNQRRSSQVLARPPRSKGDPEVPAEIWKRIHTILRFWELLLRNAIAKSVFASVDECADLLAASDDTVADAALAVLQALALPPALHKQQAPDVASNTALQQPSPAHARLTVLARGYGSRASGLGLYQLVTTDDSVYNQLPPVGQVLFSYYTERTGMIELRLTEQEILQESLTLSSSSSTTTSSASSSSNHGEKRRRVGQQQSKSTEELFFYALDKVNQQASEAASMTAANVKSSSAATELHSITNNHTDEKDAADRLFRLLADIRMARSFHSRAGRLKAVERRLRALVCILHAHPSQEIMTGYFQAQPELCVEIVDLLRPTVSSAHVTTTAAYATTANASSNSLSAREGASQTPGWQLDGIAGLADSQFIPYDLRLLAVEALTALVSRRDGSTGSLSGSSRLSTVLVELGVGKGHYLGLLPTLIRYSLASLGAAATSDTVPSEAKPENGNQLPQQVAATDSSNGTTAMDIGLAFVEATMAPQPPRNIQVLQALNMIDAVLTLTSSVVASPSGTSALTDCGLIPALLATVAAETNQVFHRLISNATVEDERRIKALLRLVTAQAVQILEGAVVTHSHALTAFHDLQGVQVLTNRLTQEIEAAKVQATPNDAMEVVEEEERSKLAEAIFPSQRVLLFSIITCLTVVFHQDSSSSSTSNPGAPPGASQLRKKELTSTLIHILDNVASYGGHLASLIATLLSDVMNSDPHIVHYVHESGIAKSFLNMVMGKKTEGRERYEPVLPPVPELIMAVPNVLAALALTEDGAKVVHELNPFPSLLRIFYHPSYAMPQCRCLLNEMTAIVGTGLDEIMRHVERLKPLVFQALASAMKEVVQIAKELAHREEDLFGLFGPPEFERAAIETDRTCLIQYVLNFGQLLEQILHNEDHCEPFVEAGGLDALLRLYPASMAAGYQFLSHVSCLSSPSVSTLHHSTTEESLALAFKCIQFRYNSHKLLQKIVEVTSKSLDRVEASGRALFGEDQALQFALDKIPQEPMYKLAGEASVVGAQALAVYLKNVAVLQWKTGLLATSIKAIVQRSQEPGSDWMQTDKEWKKLVMSSTFRHLLDRLSAFFQSSLFEVCRVRTEPRFEESERERAVTRVRNLRYRLRIVCPEGAVVRDGIEIDSCANVGSMEMGEIDESFDRCINSSGILRYRIKRGWVSEMTRGHGREPIAEVISIFEAEDEVMDVEDDEEKDDKQKVRIEAALPGLRVVAVGVLARGQNCYSELFGALSKLSIQCIRSMPVTVGDFAKSSAGECVATTIQVLSKNANSAFNQTAILRRLENKNVDSDVGISHAGVAMYYGCILSYLQACLFEDKRERRMVNLPLLVSLLSSDSYVSRLFQKEGTAGIDSDQTGDSTMGLFGACSFIFDAGLRDLQTRTLESDPTSHKLPRQRVARSVAASFPPLLTFLRRLMSTPVATSPAASIMSRVKWKDIPVLLGKECMTLVFVGSPEENSFFEPECFVRGLNATLFNVIKETWLDKRFMRVPPHLLHPFVSLVGDVIVMLDDATKKKQKFSSSSSTESGYNLSDYFRHRRRRAQEAESAGTEFEVDESAVAQLAEMGFDRDRAIDAMENTRSTRVEIAMEYCLTHPPPSPGTIARRRTEREERQRRRAETQAGLNRHGSDDTISGANGSGEAMDVDQSSSSTVTTAKVVVNDGQRDLLRAEEELAFWIEEGPKICSRFLGNMDAEAIDDRSVANGDGEAEATTVVLCSFMLDLCHRYPTKRTEIVSHVLEQLTEKIGPIDHSRRRVITTKAERSVAALCHATVLLTRALPKTRVLVLQKGLVGSIVACVEGLVASNDVDLGEIGRWPMWLAPSLLLLDIMAQPVVGFNDDENISVSLKSENQSVHAEFTTVRDEHKAQAKELSELAHRVFLLDGTIKPDAAESKSNGSETREVKSEKLPDAVENGSCHSTFDFIPAYFPLLPLETVGVCLDFCLKLLGAPMCSKNGVRPSPGVTHATLLLLLRLLRTPTNSTKCRKSGLVEAILALPGESKFTGNAGLVALIFRRLLEDATTLQGAMETEMRGTVSKLQGKRASSSPGEGQPVSLRAFMEAVTPLLCRDPNSFLNAMALTVKVEPGANESADPTIVLLSCEERLQRGSSALEHTKGMESQTGKGDGLQSSKASPASKAKGKSLNKARRNSFSKRTKRDRYAGQKSNTQTQSASESSASHICTLLLNSIMSTVALEGNLDSFESTEDTQFLWVGSRLEILSDLVLAMPACACAVHNFRPHKNKDKVIRAFFSTQLPHALGGCPNPARSFVNFLLHTFLPQDRWSIRNDSDVWDRRKGQSEEDTKNMKIKKERAFRIMKASQAAARVILALVARPGEGRKRVITDLIFALSGGRMGHGHVNHEVSAEETKTFSAKELLALQAWGEVCVAIAAPRSTGRNIEGLGALSIENVRAMLEHGMVHALLYAINRIKLFHPMASSACGSLLMPLECLTRPAVAEAVKQHIAKERNKDTVKSSVDNEGENAEINGQAGNAAVEPAVNETIEYEMMVEPEQNTMDEADGTAEDVEMDRMNHDRSEDEDNSSEEESEETPSSDEESESDVDEGSDDNVDESSTLDDSDEVQSEAVDDEGDWNVGNNDPAFAGENSEELQGVDEWDEEGTDRVEQAVDEGWTRIESSGFGGMLLGGRRNFLATGASGDRNSRSRGFIGAAEAMIGSLLRNGEISSETLAEIEGSLGIRIMGNNRSIQATLGVEGTGGVGLGDSLAVRVLGADGGQQEQGRRSEVIGTLPHIHQRGPPDVGYSAFGNGGRWAEVSAMEFVFGGPSLTAGSRNYDLITPLDDGSEHQVQPHLTQLDLQLYPGGPASASAARTQHSLHPLLCGVDLPPLNSLVSDLLPHGVRATRLGQMTTRRPGDWTSASLASGGYLVSTSNGNIIRSNRSHAGAQLGNGLTGRHVAGPVGWTDDGLPVDATVEEFSAALERALAETYRTRAAASSSHSTSVDVAVDRSRDEADPSNATNQTSEETVSRDNTTDRTSHEEAGITHQENEHGVGQLDQESPLPSDGDRVASSLAAGLRLSPGSDAGAGSDAMSTGHSAGEEALGTTNSTESETRMEGANSENIARSGECEQGQSTDEPEDAAPEDTAAASDTQGDIEQQAEQNDNGLVCPPDIDLEVFNSLPVEMQRDCVSQYIATQELAAQLDGSTLDPEVLAALPEDMRREVIEQDRRERELREQAQAPADPNNAEDMDNASFIASLSPELREEILLTADETFLNSLPPNIVAEAQIIRERATAQHRRLFDDAVVEEHRMETGHAGLTQGHRHAQSADSGTGSLTRKKPRSGKLKVESDRQHITYVPDSLPIPVAVCDIMSLVRLLYLLSPVRPSRLLQKVFQNFSSNPSLRRLIASCFVQLLHGNSDDARAVLESLGKVYAASDHWRRSMDKLFSDEDFPPSGLLGAAPDLPDSDAFSLSVSSSLLRQKQGVGTAAALAANLPQRAGLNFDSSVPPVVASRIVETLLQLCKNSPRFCHHMLVDPTLDETASKDMASCFDELLDLLEKPMYSRSSANLDQLLTLLESVVSPLSQIPRHGDEEIEIPQKDIEAAAAAGKEWVEVPRVTVSQSRLQMLCSILRMETCRDTSFTKVNTIVRKLCRIESNRGFVLAELASVAHGLGADAIRDLRALKIRMDLAATYHQNLLTKKAAMTDLSNGEAGSTAEETGRAGHISSSVTLSTSSSELKLLRVLQTLQALCGENWEESGSYKKNENTVIVTEELVHLLRQLEFGELWDELSSCLRVVQVLEGVKVMEDDDKKDSEEMETNDDASGEDNVDQGKKLRNSAAGLLSRFLPSIEAFFVANACAIRPKDKKDHDTFSGRLDDIPLENLVGGERLMEFVATNKVLLNALVRNNSNLLDKGLRALVQVPRCRVFLDFDVKRQWFKTQVRRLRQQASRRHGSLRLHIRRKYVFEDAYHQLRLRNADEMRGRLHITFRNEAGVDAGGLSREFFGILAKEIFNPNYALFTSTEDGCTFQPNPNSSINPDHLSYFRFVGRIVGKAVADGFLLDAHFTRSLYKHMLGLKPTHHDMEAIDPDYYKNLKTILEFNLADIGLDLTFSIEDHSFGRSQTIDLIPNGRTVCVTEENKEEYVRLVCQHRMTTAIQSQIKSYLDGFYELVSPDLIAIFTPRELELLISGLPDIDVHDLKKNTEYVGWKANDKEIEWFWNILFSLGRNEKASFLQFVTGSSKVPLAGFAELQGMRGTQKFSIHKASGKAGALMSAHTCFNSLDLPNYGSQEEMREKLLYAINEGGGAFLFA